MDESLQVLITLPLYGVTPLKGVDVLGKLAIEHVSYSETPSAIKGFTIKYNPMLPTYLC